jgi:hypothetical protein
MRKGFIALAPLAVVSVIAGAVAGGERGAVSAAVGVGLVAANHLVAALSTGWSRTLSPKVVGVGYAVFVVRMAVMLGLFGTLSTLAWVDGPVLAISFCAALVVTLGAECLSYARGSYIPAWMRREAPLLIKETR